jgi:hypothetical protein
MRVAATIVLHVRTWCVFYYRSDAFIYYKYHIHRHSYIWFCYHTYKLILQATSYSTTQELLAAHFTALLTSILVIVDNKDSTDMTATDTTATTATSTTTSSNSGVSSSTVSNSVKQWKKATPERAVYDVLLRAAPLAVAQHLADVIPIFMVTLQPDTYVLAWVYHVIMSTLVQQEYTTSWHVHE